jgi:Kef-type K+ transport system membrane component KefB
MPAATAVHFFLELAVILIACRIVGLASQRLGQPQVVGEMVAGVLLGPSLLGRIAPDLQHHLFPPGASNAVLYTAAQIGLVLYMFLIGLNFDANLIKHRVSTAAAVSAAGIFAPLALGALIAVPLLANGTYFDKSVTLVMAMMFLGASIATTAFPMLARIIHERRLSGTPLGTLALACGATDDALSWCILATVLAVHRGSALVAVTAIVGGILYTLVLLTFGRRAFRVFGTLSERRNTITAPVLSTVLILLMTCAWFTDAIGIYAIFGAFILGVAMPSGFFAERMTASLEPLVTTFLLPLFFVYSGLNTQIGLVNSPTLWAVTFGILIVSIAGKGIACTAAARLRGISLRESVALGALMNARGLIELILLNIGLEAGIITPTLFTILVLAAIVTTLMATPVFELVYGRHRENPEGALPGSAREGTVPSSPTLKEPVATRLH